MRSPRLLLAICLLTITGSLLLASGCAKQDLYEPPGSTYTRVGRVPLPSQNEGVAVIGRYAFVAGGQAGLHSIDFTNPSQPVLLATSNTLKYSESVEAVRTFVDNTLIDICHVVEGTEGITSYNVTDPATLTSYNTTTTAVFGNRIFIEQMDDPNEPYNVYLAESWKGVRAFESIPAQPGILNYNGVFVGTNGYAEGIAVKDGWGYVADDEMGICVLDLRILELESVEIASWADTPGEALDVEVEGDYAFVADGYGGLAVMHIEGGNQPVRVAGVNLEGKCRGIAVRDGLAVLAAQGSGINFVDVSNPLKPVFLGREDTSYAMDVCISREGFVLIADRDDGLIIMQGEKHFADTTAPSPVTNLTAEPFGNNAVRLAWYNAGDDRMEGTAASLEIRYADTIIDDEAAWDAATVVTGSPAPDAPGTAMDMVIVDLVGGTERFFSIRYTDDAGNVGSLSNSPSAIPGEGILLTDASLDILGGTTTDTYTYRVTYVFDEPATVHQVLIDGSPFVMVEDEAKAGEVLYIYEATLDKGEHTYSFHFETADTEVPPVTTPAADGPVVGGISFTMGSPDTELGRQNDEWLHTVVLSDSLIAKSHEVTQAEWEAAGLLNPSGFTGADLPVETVSWLQAIQYCNVLSVADGLTSAYAVDGQSVTWNDEADGWRLPTEAEWEWLCRAGSAGAYASGDITAMACNDDPVLQGLGWYCGSFSGATPGTRDVGLKSDNGRDLYDMHGNVYEWCWDWYGDYRVDDDNGDGVILDPQGPSVGTTRVLRGGSWDTGSETCRSADRQSRVYDSTDNFIGLRVVRTIFDD